MGGDNVEDDMTTSRTQRTGETTAELIERLVERGRRVEAEGVERVRALTGGLRDQVSETIGSLEEAVEQSTRRALERARIPTREELERLAGRIDDLAGLVRELQAPRDASTTGDRTYHVAPHPEGGWKVEAEELGRASSTHRTKAEAVRAGRELAGRRAPARLVVHRADGTIQEHRSYD